MVGNAIRVALVVLMAGATVPGTAAVAQQGPMLPPELATALEDQLLWALAQRRDTADAYRNYLATFPKGTHAAEARARLADMGAPQPAPVAPVQPPPPVSGTPLNAANAEAALALNLADRRAVQARLTALGHDTRGVDGVFGSGTRSAIRAWQSARGYGATGYLSAAQLQELRGAAPAAATGTPAAAEAALELTPTQRRIIQSRLTQMGHDTNGIDGRFGPGTRRAITAWQRASDVAATGYLSAADATALLNAGTTAPTAPGDTIGQAARAERALNLTRDDRLAVQRALVAAGHDTRGIDGAFGAGSRRAIRDWQAARGMAATGYLTGDQFRALRGVIAAPTAASAADEARLNLSDIGRAEVLGRLSALGYETNRIDGSFGPAARAAIARWQGDNGLAASGYLNADQLSRLRAQRRN